MPPALFVSLVLLVAAAKKEKKNAALVVGTQLFLQISMISIQMIKTEQHILYTYVGK
jgi:hypothetical protein